MLLKTFRLEDYKKTKLMAFTVFVFYQLEKKKNYYPSRKDEEATNPNGSKLR